MPRYFTKHIKIILPLTIICAICVSLTADVPVAQVVKIPFWHVIIDNHGPKDPWVKLVGDFNGDGFVDVAIGGQSGPLVWYAYPDWTKTVIAEGGYHTVDGEAGRRFSERNDVDGDGDLDIVIGAEFWYENPHPDGTPAKVPWPAHRISDFRTHDIELGDFDGDGDLDLVARDQSGFGHEAGNRIHFWRQNALDNWEYHAIDCPHGEGLTLGDLDQDGDPDVIIGGYWYENEGDIVSGKWTEHHFATWHQDAAVQMADINGDSRPDVVLTRSEGPYKASWFEAPKDPKQSNWKEHIIDESVDYAHGVGVSDMDGDGDLDVVTAEMHQSARHRVLVYINEGNGLRWTTQIVATTGSHDLHLADVDSDGDFDIIGANWSGDYQPVEMWENQRIKGKWELTFEHHIVDTEFWGDCKAIGDINGDGFNDLLIANQSWLIWYAYPNWTRTFISRTGENFTTDMELDDIDKDGDVDVIVPDGPTGKLQWFENPRPTSDPAEDAWKPHLIGHHGSYAHDIEVGDLDGDGALDVVTRPKGTQIYIWRQDTPDFWTQRIINCPAGEGLTIGDIDTDGDLDVIIGGRWYEASGDIVSGPWTEHIYANWPHGDTYPKMGNINGDGRPDIVLTPSEGVYRLSWFEAPSDPRTGSWPEHVIQDPISFSHSIGIADMDLDGAPDIVTAEMAQSPPPHEVIVFINGGGGVSWTKQVVATTGSHNLRLGDIDNDGDIDLYGSNWQDPPVGQVEFWRNRLDLTGKRLLDKWTYIQVDDSRPGRAFGLAMGDINGDGYGDIVSSSFFYRNPGGDMTGKWDRITLPENVDAMLIVDVDGDAFSDLIAEKLPDVYWLEAEDTSGNFWRARKIASIPQTSHGNGQGYALAQIVAGGKPEILLSSGRGMYALIIPDQPDSGTWPVIHITDETSEEGIGVGDFDNDGDSDVCAPTDNKEVAWWENPHPRPLSQRERRAGEERGNWTKHHVGMTENGGDRFAVADLNRDGHPDIIVTEETPQSGASVYWFENPTNPNSDWVRHQIVTQYTTNNLDVADMDNDGDVDLITAEHRGTKKLQIWENVKDGQVWVEHIVDQGKESHLGARVADLDGDGALEIVSIAWDNYQNLHLWRNDAERFALAILPAPLMSPKGGVFSEVLSVTLTMDVSGAEIRYTRDGSDPTAASPLYSSPIRLTESTTIRARAFTSGSQPSEVVTANFTKCAQSVARLTDHLIALYTFADGPANTIPDVSSVGEPLQFTVTHTAAIQRTAGGVRFRSSGLIVSEEAALKLTHACRQTNEITIEVWVQPESVSLSGPVRIVTLSADPYHRNFTLGQEGFQYNVRLRTTITGENGMNPSLSASGVATEMTHIVYTRDASGVAKIYINGQERASQEIAGDFSNWDENYRFALGNELTGDRAWKGEIRLVAVYNRALTPSEVARNFCAGL